MATNYMVLTIVVKGENIMGNPLLTANGFAVINGKQKKIEKETPITSIPAFIEAFEGLFQEET